MTDNPTLSFIAGLSEAQRRTLYGVPQDRFAAILDRAMAEARQAMPKPAPEQPMLPMADAQPGDAHAHHIEMLRRLEARMCCGHNYQNRVGMKRVRAYLGIGRPTLARMLERHGLELGRSGSSSGTKYWVAWGDLLRVLGVDENELTRD